MIKKPKVIEIFSDNGEHSHWELINVETHEVLWSEENQALNQHDVSNNELAFKSGWLKADDHPFDKDIRLAEALKDWKLLNDY